MKKVETMKQIDRNNENVKMQSKRSKSGSSGNERNV